MIMNITMKRFDKWTRHIDEYYFKSNDCYMATITYNLWGVRNGESTIIKRFEVSIKKYGECALEALRGTTWKNIAVRDCYGKTVELYDDSFMY